MNRIEAIVSNITSKDKVVDIGCDQVEVGVLLAKNGIKSIASDISKNVVDSARIKISNLNLDKYIDLRQGNGLESINENESDTLVVAGMGALTIIDILSNTNLKFKKIISISNNNHDILREKMNDLNYIVSKEMIIKEKRIYYNLILFIPGNKKYQEKEILIGLNFIEDDIYHEWKQKLINKYKDIQIQSNYKNSKINKIIKYLEES